jgi:uncharacterized membrane protein YeiH
MATGIDNPIVWGTAWIAGFALRSAAIRWQIALPSYDETESTTD